MKLLRAQVIVFTGGVDQVSIETDLPGPFTYNSDEESLKLKFEATKGTGVAYVKKYFPDLPVTIVNAGTGKKECT